jgi:hypothetical protein
MHGRNYKRSCGFVDSFQVRALIFHSTRNLTQNAFCAGYLNGFIHHGIGLFHGIQKVYFRCRFINSLSSALAIELIDFSKERPSCQDSP